MPDDAAFTRLITAVPGAAFAAFAPDLHDHWGPPSRADLEPTKALSQISGTERSRFFDLAIRFTWPDDAEPIILLIAHWSRARDIDLVRVLQYTQGAA